MAIISLPSDYVSVYAITMGADICLTVEDCSRNNAYIKALKKVLEDHGIKYSIEPYKLHSEPAYRGI